MGTNTWTTLINADSLPTDPDSIKICNDFYCSLAQALSDEHSSSIIDDYCDSAPNGDGDGYTAWHALVKSIETKEQNVIMAEAFSQQLSNMKIEHKGDIVTLIKELSYCKRLTKIGSVNTKLKEFSLNPLLM